MKKTGCNSMTATLMFAGPGRDKEYVQKVYAYLRQILWKLL